MPIPERKEIEEAFECYKRFDNDKRNIYDLREGEFNLISKQLAKSRETYSKLVKAYLSGELVDGRKLVKKSLKFLRVAQAQKERGE